MSVKRLAAHLRCIGAVSKIDQPLDHEALSSPSHYSEYELVGSSANRATTEDCNIRLAQSNVEVIAYIATTFDPNDLQLATNKGQTHKCQRLLQASEFLEHAQRSLCTTTAVAASNSNMLTQSRLLNAGAAIDVYAAIRTAAKKSI